MPIILILIAAGAFALYMEGDSSATDMSSLFGGFNMQASAPTSVGGYKDVDPSQQGGSWDTSFDGSFQRSGQKNGVPFALLKSHAIRESALNPNAIRNEPSTSTRPPSASYGLMQILWWKSSNRFASYGYSDDFIADGSVLYNSEVNTDIAAHLIKENLNRFGNLRDAINAYNTGVAESVRVAPGNYVDDVLNIYSTLVGSQIT
jgi:soluble lytic murein transglycosylase-like protein